jgi:hypothetical protein
VERREGSEDISEIADSDFLYLARINSKLFSRLLPLLRAGSSTQRPSSILYYRPDISIDLAGPEASSKLARILYGLRSRLIYSILISPEASLALSVVPA